MFELYFFGGFWFRSRQRRGWITRPVLFDATIRPQSQRVKSVRRLRPQQKVSTYG